MHMDIIIDERLSMAFTSPYQESVIRDDTAVYLAGNLYGAYYDKKLLSKDEVMNLFCTNSDNIEQIVDIMQCTIGGFYIILRNNDKVSILSSTATPGLFYSIKNNKIYISDDEKKIYSLSSFDDLDEYEIFNFVSSESNRAPFNTLFKDVKRIPGGSLCTITPSLHIDHRLYIKKSIEQISSRAANTKATKSYEEFRTAIEQIARIIAENTDDKDIYIMLSGGVDSVALLLAFLKTDLNLHIIHWRRSKYEDNIVEALSRKLGFAYDVFDSWSINADSDVRRIESMYQSMLATMIQNPYILLNKHVHSSTNKPKLIISGQNMDANYCIHCFGSSVNVGIGFYRAHLKYALKLFCYTEYFFRIINNIKPLIQLYVGRGERIWHPYYQYLLSVSHGLFDSVIPFKLLKKQYYFADENQRKVYREIKENTVINTLLSQEDLAFIDSKSIKGNINYFNHLIRLQNFLIYSQSASLTFSNYGRFFKFNLTMPVDSGLLNDYFTDFRLNSPKDVFLPKSYLYRYINENLGESYSHIAKRSALISGYSLTDGIFRFLYSNMIRAIMFMKLLGAARFIKYRLLRRQIPEQSEHTVKNSKREFYLVLKKLWEEHELREFNLINKIENPHIKDYLNSIGKLLIKESRDLSAKEVGEIEHLVNLKVYLNSINFQGNLITAKKRH